ncbi:MAG: tyrosine-type recombinase/integrase [Acidimicrobiales bacterium]
MSEERWSTDGLHREATRRARLARFIYFAADKGMRWSELVGLRRGDVDVAARKVRVTSQLVRLERGEWLRKEPKAPASIRSITISQFTANLLTSHLDSYSLTGTHGLVFPDAASQPLMNSSFWSNHFRPAMAKAGVRCRVHDLRHTSVALAIAAGAHPRRSRRGWATRRSTSPSTATATCFRSSTRPSPRRSTRGSPPRLGTGWHRCAHRMVPRWDLGTS